MNRTGNPTHADIDGTPIPAADDVHANPVLFTQSRALELLAQFQAVMDSRPLDMMRELGPQWAGGMSAIMEGLLHDAGVRKL